MTVFSKIFILFSEHHLIKVCNNKFIIYHLSIVYSFKDTTKYNLSLFKNTANYENSSILLTTMKIVSET